MSLIDCAFSRQIANGSNDFDFFNFRRLGPFITGDETHALTFLLLIFFDYSWCGKLSFEHNHIDERFVKDNLDQ